MSKAQKEPLERMRKSDLVKLVKNLRERIVKMSELASAPVETDGYPYRCGQLAGMAHQLVVASNPWREWKPPSEDQRQRDQQLGEEIAATYRVPR
jgi:hypothetical protein